MPVGECVEWVRVETGVPFLMGSPETEVGRGGDDWEIQHEVTLTHDFEITSREVSQRWYEDLFGTNPAGNPSCGPDCPVESISWNAAAVFCLVISTLSGLTPCYECTGSDPVDMSCGLAAGLESPYECEGYRLPTEAEWEHAARAGTTTATYRGELDAEHLACEAGNATLDPIAWFCGNTETPRPSAELLPNALGLYDMLGNVGEFTFDYHQGFTADPQVDPFGPVAGELRTARGGSYFNQAWEARAACRIGSIDPILRYLNIGLRPVRTVQE
jgi:formylglycine-generating enzyme required for sulfatase activity